MDEKENNSGFDPNAAAAPGEGIFGLPFTEEEAALVLLPIAWEVTTSYGGGTSRGPAAILRASHQVDLEDLDVESPYEAGICLLPEARQVRAWNDEGRPLAEEVRAAGGASDGPSGGPSGGKDRLEKALARVNELGEALNAFVHDETRRLLEAGKIVGIVGGEHSAPFGALAALAGREPSFGILHIDAHLDAREAYEGFCWSHASILRNVLDRLPQVETLVQVAARDFCPEELGYCHAQGGRVRIFFGRDLDRRRYGGEHWSALSQEIVEALPPNVWVSFDIDGLDPSLCPHTGTPVPGGLSLGQADYLLEVLVRSGRRILGFDLCEVAPPPTGSAGPAEGWDGNVGARLLYKLAAWTLASRGLCRLLP